MFSLFERVFHRVWAVLWRLANDAWALVSRLATLLPRAGRDLKQQRDSPNETRASLFSLPDVQSDALTQAREPPRIEYIPVPGPWAREEHPRWSDSVFEVPKRVLPGEIYYVTKGEFVDMGGTAIVEQLPSGHIVKSPKPNPYDRSIEQRNRDNMVREASIYARIGTNAFVPRLVSWDRDNCMLVLEHQVNGDLQTYAKERWPIKHGVREKWALQAAEALAAVHAADVVHHDVAPRNFVLNGNLNVRICDFAGSSSPDHPVSDCAPGSRYQPATWNWDVPSKLDDVFGLGSVIYFIMTGEEPFSDLGDAEVRRRFSLGEFPDTSALRCGSIIQDCWAGQLTTSQSVVQALSGITSSLASSGS